MLKIDDIVSVREDHFGTFFPCVILWQGAHGPYQTNALFYHTGQGGWSILGHRAYTSEGDLEPQVIDIFPPVGPLHEPIMQKLREDAAVVVNLRGATVNGKPANGNFFKGRLFKRFGKSSAQKGAIVDGIEAECRELENVEGASSFDSFDLGIDSKALASVDNATAARLATMKLLDGLPINHKPVAAAVKAVAPECYEWLADGNGFFNQDQCVTRMGQLVEEFDLDGVEFVTKIARQIVAFKTGAASATPAPDAGDDSGDDAPSWPLGPNALEALAKDTVGDKFEMVAVAADFEALAKQANSADEFTDKVTMIAEMV